MINCTINKFLHHILTAFVSVYLTFVFLIRPVINTAVIKGESFHPILSLIICAVFWGFVYFVLHHTAHHAQLFLKHCDAKKRFSRPLFWGVSAAVFVVYIMYLLSDYPGGFSPDTLWQWEQAHTLDFNDHHPFFHTLLFWLLTRIWDSYTFMLLVQIAAFSLGFGYLAATMYAWGFRLSLILLFTAAGALSFATRSIALFFWKDSALSVFFLFFLSHIFNILLSKGEWLKKTRNWIASSILLACITLVRHNAILLTAPMLILLLLSYPRIRRISLKLIAAVLVLIIGVKGPLQTFCGVEPVPSTYLETTGLPMTILCSAYALAPDTMPPEAYAFMETLAPQDQFAQLYQFGNYNSVKWAFSFTENQLSPVPVSEFLGMVWKTAVGNPMLALRSVLELTAMVWEPSGQHYDLSIAPYGTPPAYVPISGQIQPIFEELFQVVDSAFAGSLVQKFTSQLGILNLALILALYFSIHKTHGWTALWIVLPILCYTFGTMLLLSGPDFRFFHFNCLAAWPLVMLLFSTPAGIQSETCK